MTSDIPSSYLCCTFLLIICHHYSLGHHNLLGTSKHMSAWLIHHLHFKYYHYATSALLIIILYIFPMPHFSFSLLFPLFLVGYNGWAVFIHLGTASLASHFQSLSGLDVVHAIPEMWPSFTLVTLSLSYYWQSMQDCMWARRMWEMWATTGPDVS